MHGLAAIQKRIQANACEEADEILREADKAAAEILAEQDKAGQRLLAEARSKAEVQAEAIVSRARSLAALDQRKALLRARQQLVDQTLQHVLDRLCRLPAADKLAFYRLLVERSGLTEGEVILAGADRDLGPLLLADRASGLTLSAEAGSFAGGLVVRRGLIEENLTFETLLKNNHAAWVSLAASVLFDLEQQPGGPEAGRDPA